MTLKILSIYCLNNKVVVTTEEQTKDSKSVINKLQIKADDFSEIIQSPFNIFIEELNNNLKSYNEDLLIRRNEELNKAKKSAEISSDSPQEAESGESYDKVVEKYTKVGDHQKYITIQGSSIPTELFEEIMDVSFQDFLNILGMIKKETYNYSAKLEKLREKAFLASLNSKGLKVATRMTKRVYIQKGATDYMKENLDDYLNLMYAAEGKFGEVVVSDTDKLEEELVRVEVRIDNKRIITPVFHKSTLTPITKQ